MRLFGERPLTPAELASIGGPPTLIWGRHDRATQLAVAVEASRLYGWPLRVIEHANDDPAVEQPEALALLLLGLAAETIVSRETAPAELGLETRGS
jgi:pimeloyl-ACP methyl ester carboxylesterase